MPTSSRITSIRAKVFSICHILRSNRHFRNIPSCTIAPNAALQKAKFNMKNSTVRQQKSTSLYWYFSGITPYMNSIRFGSWANITMAFTLPAAMAGRRVTRMSSDSVNVRSFRTACPKEKWVEFFVFPTDIYMPIGLPLICQTKCLFTTLKLAWKTLKAVVEKRDNFWPVPV